MASGNLANEKLHYKLYMSESYQKDKGKISIQEDINL